MKEDKYKETRDSLKAAYARNSDAYTIIGSVSGLGVKVIRDIANGKHDPTQRELVMLQTLSRG